MSKALYRLGLIFAFLPLAIALITLLFLPETFPTRSDQWTDKWSTTGIISIFAIPLFSLAIYGFLRLITPGISRIAKESDQSFDPKHWEITVLFIMIIMLLCYAWMLTGLFDT